MNRLEEYVNVAKLNDLVNKNEEKKANPFITALAVIGILTAIAAIAYAVYKYIIPDYFEDYDEFDDEFEEDFEAEIKDEEAVEEVMDTEEIII